MTNRGFLYLHYLDPHLPYGPLEREAVRANAAAIAADTRPVNADALEAIRGQSRLSDGASALDLGVAPNLRLLELAYHAGVERFDRGVGEVLASLEANDLLNSTAVLVTSDHGESLYTRGFGNHGTSFYDDEVAIPLVLRWPGLAQQPATTKCVTSIVDVMPLLCTLAGIACPAEVDGRDRVTRSSAERGVRGDGMALLEGLSHSPRHRGVVQDTYKLLWEPEGESGRDAYRLFDLANDPAELEDIGEASAEVVAQLRKRLDALPKGLLEVAPQTTLPAGEVDRLRELGYGD